MSRWSAADIPDQTGRTVLVTGATSGLGRHTATVLAGHGATVLMTCRDPDRGRAAREQLRGAADADATLVQLGLTDTQLVANTVRMRRARLLAPVSRWGFKLIAQGVRRGSLPQLYAATAVGVRSGEYYGPTWLGETRGAPGPAAVSPAARDERTAQLLWERTAELTGVTPDPA